MKKEYQIRFWPFWYILYSRKMTLMYLTIDIWWKFEHFIMEDRGGGAYFIKSCLSFCESPWNFNLSNTVWTLGSFTWVFLVARPFHGNQQIWPWPWSLTYFLKYLTLLITFKQIWYFIRVFLVAKSCMGNLTNK